MSRKSRVAAFLAGAAVTGAAAGARKARSGVRDVIHGRFTCNCSVDKRTGRPREFRSLRLLNAHHYARHGGYWAGKGGKAVGRKMDKGADNIRRVARGGLEAFGHVDRLGRRTDRHRSRPVTPAGRTHLSLRDLRQRARHGGGHDGAETRERKAETAAARGRHGKAGRLRDKAARLRATAGMTRGQRRAQGRQPAGVLDGGYNMIPRSHPAYPSRAPQRPAPARARPAPARTGRAPRT